MKFVDLFAGMGGFHLALTALDHECVFASEIDPELRELYAHNFPSSSRRIFGDIRDYESRVPQHDILCAGFPCQPFSKSGAQLGLRDKIRGTLFQSVVNVLRLRQPQYVILENVGNFERHDGGRTWQIVQQCLKDLGYDVRGTTHITSGGHGLISPHHLGYPQTRERFYMVASLASLPCDPFPVSDRQRKTDLRGIVESSGKLSNADREETRLSRTQIRCIHHWNKFLARIPEEVELPSFPIWGDEFGARYPYEHRTPFAAPTAELRRAANGSRRPSRASRDQLLLDLPAYARSEEPVFPKWKVRFIQQNRAFYRVVARLLPPTWLEELKAFPPSLRKLEWNCKGEDRDLWEHVLQFRPSGLRAKRYSSSPALVAMTTTQVPILGPERRFLTRVEGLRLQGFPDSHRLPESRAAAFAALGNAVHVGVANQVASALIGKPPTRMPRRHSLVRRQT